MIVMEWGLIARQEKFLILRSGVRQYDSYVLETYFPPREIVIFSSGVRSRDLLLTKRN